ncbi:ABC transporter permease [Colwellia sp. Bg11-12]|uniref:ABC transporter permease n=1 Tax=Colwellia sp. Bg11-12 TaxID=2759817 RepID=UPI0015F35AF6|nr:ABC transporter permease [Colwellia sp. Bg11-12]MBA6264475.1 ABC transporter permease [Colwellia sp. Bg11-12]
MIVNYFVTALRAIKKDKQHFFLNVSGFSVGIAAAILMALFAQHELSYDKHQPDSERVYLAHTDWTSIGLQAISQSSYSNAETFKNHSQVEDIFRLVKSDDLSRLNLGGSKLVQVDGNDYRLNNFYSASTNILDFIALDIIAGDITQALTQPNQLVLSESEALRLFGESLVVGRTLKNQQGQYTIGAIFKDLAQNSHAQFDSLIHMPAKFIQEGQGYAYYKLLANTDIASFEQQLTTKLHKSWGQEGSSTITMTLINMEDLHLKSNGPFVMKEGGSSTVLQICIALSVMLIVIASINFINLNIAQSAKRAKEVGVRKALGASKWQLVGQFLTESFLVVTLAALIAFTLVETSLPVFNQMVDRQLSLNSGFILSASILILAIGLLSGLYPALFVASFSAKRVLSGDLVRGATAVFVRKLTLCLQGALSVGLIIAAIFLSQQINLIDNLAVGYEKSSRLVIKELPSEALYTQKNNSLLTSIRNFPGVEQVTLSSIDLTNDIKGSLYLSWPNGETLTGPQPTIATGYYAVETLGLTLLAGRDFSPQFSGDWYQIDDAKNSTVGVLVSRRMVELAGYPSPESVIGLTLMDTESKLTAKVVGVIENVKVGSARQQALPISINLGFYGPLSTGHIIIKASNANMAKLRSQVRQLIRQELHLSDVKITTLADDYANAHKNEHRALEMVTLFSLLAIFLSCLGTFGLASFATLRRQKEVAMRKVLGASRLSIVNLLAKEFLLLVAISIVIAYPLSYWLIGDWLANFNERIEQTVWVYVIAAAMITVITWLTVASLAFKAASSRPSLTLRDE